MVIFLTAPDVTIMMESGSFVLSAPSGDLTPAVDGSPAPSLVPGKVGSALRLDGAELNYGNPTTECFYDISMCTNGLSVSLWVKYHAISTTAPRIILDGGGFYGATRGLTVFRAGAGVIAVNIYTDNNKYNSRAPHDDWFEWQHIAFTWKVSNDILLFLNGCPAGIPRALEPHGPVTVPPTLIIGGNIWGPDEDRGNIALDHVLMWYRVLTPDEIWQLYIQGGQV